jgi:DNA-directed RNA polymerase specialized sigma24 family protein
MPEEALEVDNECRHVIDRLMVERRWRLLSRQVFARRTHAVACQAGGPNRHRAAVTVYSHALYAACSGEQGRESHDAAYVELWRYLRSCAASRFADVAEDATQSALERTLSSFHKCRCPEAFLAFALQQLADAARSLRQRQVGNLRWINLGTQGEHDDAPEFQLPDTHQPDPLLIVLGEEESHLLDEVRRDFLARHPRAAQQLDAVWLKFVDDLDEVAISRVLRRPIESLYVLRSRGLAKLQTNPAALSLASERGLRSAEPPQLAVSKS